MKLIVGLGNYPKEYDLTRHNIGFMILDNFANEYNLSFKVENKFKAEIATCDINNEKILLLKPLTFMNLSGEAVQKVVSYYKINPNDILIIFDDLSLKLGKFRFKGSGSDGGHNGIKSILSLMGTNKIQRLKVGIGPQPEFLKSEAFVLQKFSTEQLVVVDKVVKFSKEIIDNYIKTNIAEVQNKYNGIDLE